MYSFLGGRFVSTSALIRRRRNGLSIAWSLETMRVDCEVRDESVAERLNHSWKLLRSLKISGRIKFKRDQSSARLFCDYQIMFAKKGDVDSHEEGFRSR